MHKIIHLENLKLVSVNQKYSVTRSGRMFLKKEYRKFKKLMSDSTTYVDLFGEDYKLKIQLEMYLDIDNPIKCIIDGISDKLGINDRNIIKLDIIKKKLKRGQLGNLKVWIGEK